MGNPMNCEVCGKELAKYKCPRCMIQTCCLACVKQHKESANCSGMRDKTAFVKMSQFKETDLLNDYRFLEEIDRCCDSNQRDSLRQSRKKPSFVQVLEKEARRRGVFLRTMPYPMEKRKNNFTKYQYKDKVLWWQIKWIFPQAGKFYIEKRNNETVILRDLLKKYLDPVEADPVIRHALKDYCKVGVESCHMFLKAEDVPANRVRYFELNPEATLGDNLKGKTIIEYPDIFVAFGGDACQYTLVDEPVRNKSTMTSNIPSTSRAETSLLVPEIPSSLCSESTDCSHKMFSCIKDTGEPVLCGGEIHSDAKD